MTLHLTLSVGDNVERFTHEPVVYVADVLHAEDVNALILAAVCLLQHML